jgi:hypothetical protein
MYTTLQNYPNPFTTNNQKIQQLQNIKHKILLPKPFITTDASRTLINAEKNYSATEKELLAIVWGCKQLGNICTTGSLPLLLTTNLSHRSLM